MSYTQIIIFRMGNEEEMLLACLQSTVSRIYGGGSFHNNGEDMEKDATIKSPIAVWLS